MSLALAGQFTRKFSGRRQDTNVMNLGSPPTGTDPWKWPTTAQARRHDTGNCQKGHDTLLLYARRQSHGARFDGLFRPSRESSSSAAFPAPAQSQRPDSRGGGAL